MTPSLLPISPGSTERLKSVGDRKPSEEVNLLLRSLSSDSLFYFEISRVQKKRFLVLKYVNSECPGG